MEFQTLFNQHLEELHISTKELSEYTGLSASTISRYRHGERTPLVNSSQYHALLDCFAYYGKVRELTGFEIEQLEDLYESVLLKNENHYQNFLRKFRLLLDYPAISIKDMAGTLNYDISYLYKIKNGQRQPQNLENFINAVSSFTAKLIKDEAQAAALSSALGLNILANADYTTIEAAIRDYLLESTESTSIPDAESFLNKLDSFHLNDYIQAIHFNDIKISTLPFSITPSKTYYGLEKMREAELDFFKSTALSRSKAEIFMHSDMPMIEMADDMEFNKKWMFGIAATIKKGLCIRIIHHLDRPFEELMLGLEAWIPIYMTGQVLPYYLPSSQGNKEPVFHHLNYVSGSCALSGQCIAGHHNDGKYELFTKHEDIQFFRKKTDHILSKAKPLMEIYDETRMNEFQLFMESIQEQAYELIGESTFRNITIKAFNDFIIVSKKADPCIEFIIRHPILVDAIKNFKEACRED